jgi:hypothetical protein
MSDGGRILRLYKNTKKFIWVSELPVVHAP